MNEVLKQRVIGALVLLGVAIIFLPSFFKERRPYQVDLQTQIPARPDITPIIINDPRKLIGIDAAPVPESMFLPESNQVVVEDMEALQAMPVAATPEPVSTPSVDRVKPVTASKPPVSAAKAWVIQVASLRNAASAKTLRDKLQKRGYKAYIREVTSSAGMVSRVFIGPKLNKDAALSIKAKVDSAFKVNSLVLVFKS